MRHTSDAVGLAVVGLALLAMAGWFAFERAWAYGAKATIAAAFGVSYLVVGLAARSSGSVTQAVRRALLGGPVAYAGLFAGLQAAAVLAHGRADFSVDTAARALWATLFGYPAGFGYLYARSRTAATARRVLAAAAASVLLGAAVASVAWTSVWPSAAPARFLLLLSAGGALAVAGALPSYLVPTLSGRVDRLDSG